MCSEVGLPTTHYTTFYASFFSHNDQPKPNQLLDGILEYPICKSEYHVHKENNANICLQRYCQFDGHAASKIS